MKSTKPFGDLQTATILVIGHDPRLQNSQAEAEKVFFFEYLEKFDERPTYGPYARKYDLAHAVWDYVNELAGRRVQLSEIYVTNLCNEFLPSVQGSGTVLIPEEMVKQGVEAIKAIISQGNFRLILPMSVQVFYHLCRLGFVSNDDDRIRTFIHAARPSPTKASQGAYSTAGTAPFLVVCGQCFQYRNIPVVPILHVKQWPIKGKAVRYTIPMQIAAIEVQKALA